MLEEIKIICISMKIAKVEEAHITTSLWEEANRGLTIQEVTLALILQEIKVFQLWHCNSRIALLDLQ